MLWHTFLENILYSLKYIHPFPSKNRLFHPVKDTKTFTILPNNKKFTPIIHNNYFYCSNNFRLRIKSNGSHRYYYRWQKFQPDVLRLVKNQTCVYSMVFLKILLCFTSISFVFYMCKFKYSLIRCMHRIWSLFKYQRKKDD